MIKIDRIDHLVLTVTSIKKTCDFYCGVLGMELEEFERDRIALKFGDQKLNLHKVASSIEPKAKSPMPGSMDLCLIADTTMKNLMVHLDSHNVSIETGPVTRTGAKGPITSIYIRDPDDNLLEISTYD